MRIWPITVVILSAFISVQLSCSGNRSTTPPAASTPAKARESLKELSACNFTFSVPEWINEQKVQGIDSCVAKFEGRSLQIEIEHGMYTPVPQKFDGMENFNESEIDVSGLAARLFKYTFQDHSVNKSVTSVYVQTGPGTALDFTINSTDTNDPEEVKNIYESLRVRPK